ncbi:type II DNA restriction endonuclease R.NGOI [Neisseria gonorrhoeae]|uniref:Type II DNA restriction endonuclease R.NGOI n=1 Tax=Neisseria gonorrhoeae TaxID=485 RepID=A0A378VYM7_NEIGO|nr:type II DNA restriction endonuclease R.NGOI [Neisseria gonorrhoeae]
MNPLFTQERRIFHKKLLDGNILATNNRGVVSNADGSNTRSFNIAKGLPTYCIWKRFRKDYPVRHREMLLKQYAVSLSNLLLRNCSISDPATGMLSRSVLATVWKSHVISNTHI